MRGGDTDRAFPYAPCRRVFGADGGRRRRLLLIILTAALVLLPGLATAQDISVNFGDDTTLTQRAVQLIGLITILALAPSILAASSSSIGVVSK